MPTPDGSYAGRSRSGRRPPRFSLAWGAVLVTLVAVVGGPFPLRTLEPSATALPTVLAGFGTSAHASPGPGPAAAGPTASSSNDSAPLWIRNDTAPWSARVDAATASDPSNGFALLFGGYENSSGYCRLTFCALPDTWVRIDGNWQNVTPATLTSSDSPSARWGAAVAFDPQIPGFVLFGGTTALPNGGNDPALNDTWIFSETTGSWMLGCASCTGSGSVPPARWDAGMSFDPTSGEVVLFGGESTSSGSVVELADTWAFNGTAWVDLQPSQAPSARAAPAMAWDSVAAAIVLYGGYPLNSQTWSFDSGDWTELAPVDSPPALAGARMATDPLNGSVVLVGGCTSDPCTTDPVNGSWEYSGGDWRALHPSASVGPEASALAGLVASSSPLALLLIGGDVGGQPSNGSWSLLGVGADSVLATPSTLDVGGSTALSVQATGGVGPLAYTWFGLPPGCTSSDASSLVCSPSGTGPYSSSVRVRVVDGIGESVFSPAASIQFNALPTVRVLANPLTGVAPLQVSFTAAASGGTGTVDLAWAFGDGTTGIGSGPTHTYARGGNYTAEVWANDSLGTSGTATLQISVVDPLVVTLYVTPGLRAWTGNRTVVRASASGGEAPYDYTFTDLPSGCSNQGTNESVCSLPAVGNWTVSVSVTDQSGQRAQAETNLTATSVPPGPGPGPAPLIDRLAYPIVLAAAAVAIVVVGIALTRRRRAERRRTTVTTVPVPEAHELPPAWGSGYVPPPNRGPKRRG